MALRIAFLATPDFAVPTLVELLAQGHEIACVYSQPPRPSGRGLASGPGPVHQFARAAGLAVRTLLSLKDEEEQKFFSGLGVDAAVVVAYGLLLSKPILAAPRLGCFNLHASLLPRWRGAAPIQRAVMAGDAETGVMAMRMEEGLDTGPILMAERTAIGRKTAGELGGELGRLGADLMARSLAAIARGGIIETPQPSEGATYAKKISKQEARIDWSKSAREIDCLVRGLSPTPGAWSEIAGERLKILYAEPVSGLDSVAAPGEIIGDDLTVAAGTGALRLARVQRPGKSPMSAGESLRGFAVPAGARFL